MKFKESLDRRELETVRILNRVVTVASGGERQLGVRDGPEARGDLDEGHGVDEGGKGVTTPGSNSEGGQVVK